MPGGTDLRMRPLRLRLGAPDQARPQGISADRGPHLLPIAILQGRQEGDDAAGPSHVDARADQVSAASIAAEEALNKSRFGPQSPIPMKIAFLLSLAVLSIRPCLAE